MTIDRDARDPVKVVEGGSRNVPEDEIIDFGVLGAEKVAATRVQNVAADLPGAAQSAGLGARLEDGETLNTSELEQAGRRDAGDATANDKII